MEDISKDSKRFTHKTVVTWNEENKVLLCALGKQTIEIAASPEFKKHKGMWTPEELFVTSIEDFVKDAFMDSAKRNNLEILSYESEGHGIVK